MTNQVHHSSKVDNSWKKMSFLTHLLDSAKRHTDFEIVEFFKEHGLNGISPHVHLLVNYYFNFRKETKLYIMKRKIVYENCPLHTNIPIYRTQK